MGYTPHVLVVGGGATGTSIARDLAFRGLEVTLVERGSLASGATGRTRGLLRSGAREAVSDSERAARIRAENRRLRRIAGHCIEETGGLLVDADGGAGLDRTLAACEEADIDVEELDAGEIQRLEPRLSRTVERALFVPDGAVDPFRLAVATARSAREFETTVETHAEVTDLRVESGAVVGAELSRDDEAGTEEVRTDYVVDAAGARAGEVAAMAGLEVPLDRSRAVRVVADAQPTEAVVSRMPPSPTLVPFARRCILGADTDEDRPPDADAFGTAAVDRLVEVLSTLVPDLPETPPLRAYCGLQVSYRHSGEPKAGEKPVPGGGILLDHEARDDTWGISTVVGASVTTARLAAETVADQVCGKFGIDRACLTAERPLPGAGDVDVEAAAAEFDLDPAVARRSVDRLGTRMREVLGSEVPNPVVCACEAVTRAEVTDAIEDGTGDRADLEPVRVRTRAGMGTCQGGQCCHRLAAQLFPAETAGTVGETLKAFYDRRWAGRRHALYGEALAGAMATYALHATTMNRDVTPPSAAGGLERAASAERTDPEVLGTDLNLDAFDSGPEWGEE